MPHDRLDISFAIELYKRHRSWRLAASHYDKADGSHPQPTSLQRVVSEAGRSAEIEMFKPFKEDLNFVDETEVLTGALYYDDHDQPNPP